jgi:inner membrane protein
MNDKGGMSNLIESTRNSQLLKILFVGFLIILLQIPIGMIRGVLRERQTRQQEAVEEIASKWGRQQSIIGPMLTIPYRHRITETDRDSGQKIRIELRDATFLPDTLQVSGSTNCETRYRGIFKVPVYSAALDITGLFTRPDLSEWGIDSNDILWDRAYLTLRISDARAITNQVSLKWNDQQLYFLPGEGDFGQGFAGIHVPMKNNLSGETFKFSCRLDVNGSESLFFAPLGKETNVEITSNWSNPSFQGNWLPNQRTIRNDGFEAKWTIQYLGRNYPQKWKRDANPQSAISESAFGIKLITPIDYYRMAERSIKYEILFLVFTFAVLWLFQVLAKVRIHAIQYLLVGAGLCIFYLLELSLAEHIGFFLAYTCAALPVIALIFFYSVAVLHGYLRGIIMSIVLLLLYGYLYILLLNQDYALLVGSVCLFVVLAVIMYITRKVDWYKVKDSN